MSETFHIDPAIRRRIDEQLDALAARENVRLLFAIESGSRAWGFPSPDSDYDVRFVYLRPLEDYLTLQARRDVIEPPIEGDLDFSGWDLKKFLTHLIKPNPVMLEWLRAPIVYQADPDAFVALNGLAEAASHLRPSQYHYLHLARSQYQQAIVQADEVKLKKYFYVLRPVLALIWMRMQPTAPVPMDLPALRAGAALPNAASSALDDLLARKAGTMEAGIAPRQPALDELIEAEFRLTEEALAQPAPPAIKLLAPAESLFRRLLMS